LYLKRLEIQGFKSFVDKTILEFNNGITAIVGPNGSGKSNIADAVRWVLGEQSPKTLRGDKMEDVIFAGTESKKSVGFAEVSLILDNEDMLLPIDFLEVKVTRRLYRSGESEYLINGAECRLKDIYILLADTGIGKDGYSIISQGKVDEILSNKSEERRNIFEEAAGIMKYRMRKQESERKLEAADQNLVRIDDIINELELQIAPLEEQAKIAREYLKIKYELRDIEVSVLTDGIRRAEEGISGLDLTIKELNDEIREKGNKLDREKYENQKKNEFIKKLDEQLDLAKDKGFEIEKNIDRITSEIRLNDEKIAALSDTGTRLENEKHLLKGRIEELKSRAAEQSTQRKQYEAVSQSQQEELTTMENHYRSVMELMSTSMHETQKLRDEMSAKKLVIAQSDSEIAGMEQQCKKLDERREEIQAELKGIAEDKEKSSDSKKGLLKKKSEKEREIEELSSKIQIIQKELESLKSEYEKVLQQLNQLKVDYQSNKSKLKLFKEMEQNFEGYGGSVREILSLCKQNLEFGQGVYGAVAQLISVPEKYEQAVETAIGQAYQNIVTKSEEDAKAAIAYLKSKNLGRATFLPITSVKGRKLDLETVRQLTDIKGYLGLGTELVGYESVFTPIVDSLLGRTVIMDSIESAIEVSRRFRYSFTVVSLDGDIFRTSGAITGGSSDKGRRTGTFGRTREIPKLELMIQRTEIELANQTEKSAKMKDLIFNKEKEQAYYIGDGRKLEVRLAEINTSVDNFDQLIERESKRYELLLTDLEKLELENKDIQKRVKDKRDSLLAIEVEAGELQSEIETADEKNQAGAKAREAMNKKLTDIKVRNSETLGMAQNCAREEERLLAESAELSERITYMESEQDESAEQVFSIQNDIEGLKIQMKHYFEEKTGKVLELERLSEERKAADEDIIGAAEMITSFTETIQKLKEDVGRIEIRKVKIESDLDSYKNRLWDEYELTLTKAIEITVDKPVHNYSLSQKRISELKNSLKEMGVVNVTAIDELQKTGERLESMKYQRKDMEETREKLRKIITEVTAIMKEQFSKQLELIRQNFSVVFAELFGGGKADVILTDESNVLDSGVELHVQPPGKKLQNMMLLSGGERALTAIALLFAILKLKPSPFCLLDEIEAALDEANVIRFANYIKWLSSGTQFILVTHRKGSMEAADTLYGVTMEEKGISRIVSLKIEA
jgi:chromosome segregation protein